MTSLLDNFPPLQGAITQAQSWIEYLDSPRAGELVRRRSEENVAPLESIVWFGVKLGELLPLNWQLTFDSLLKPGEESWSTPGEWEVVRQSVHHLFTSTLQALELTRQVAAALQAQTGRKPEGLDRLLAVIEEARALETTVFRDWPSFPGPLAPADPAGWLPADASLAEALGISVEAAREKLAERRRRVANSPARIREP